MMTTTERFRSLADVQAEKMRLDMVRKQHGERLERHWLALKDHEVRGALMSDAVGDIFRAWKPFRMLSGLFSGGSAATALGAAALGRGSWPKRMFHFGLSMALPKILEHVESSSTEELLHEVQVSFERVRDYLRKRKENRRAHRTEPRDADA